MRFMAFALSGRLPGWYQRPFKLVIFYQVVRSVPKYFVSEVGTEVRVRVVVVHVVKDKPAVLKIEPRKEVTQPFLYYFKK